MVELELDNAKAWTNKVVNDDELKMTLNTTKDNLDINFVTLITIELIRELGGTIVVKKDFIGWCW